MIDPNAITTVRVGELPPDDFNLTDKIPHEIGTELKQGTVEQLANVIGAYLGTSDSLAFNPSTVADGGTLPATTSNEWMLVGKGTFHNVGGGSDIITTEELNALTSNGTYWSLAVEIPINVELAGITQNIRSGYTQTTPSEDAVFNRFAEIVGLIPEETPDATTTIKGKLKLAGDLAGTADLPTVPGLLLKSNITDVILKNKEPQTKIGGFTSGGVNMTRTSDQWLTFGTSVTNSTLYSLPASLQMSVILVNYGVSGSNSNSLASQYTNIPTLTSGNKDLYRFLSVEHGINDSAASIPLATYRANLTNFILNAKSKNWPDNKIIVINSNYCTAEPMLTTLEAYANEAILVAKEQGVQYVDIYNYTKNNGGSALLADGIHLNSLGGITYARGLVASTQGGGEFSNALSIVNGLTVGGDILTNGLSLSYNAGSSKPFLNANLSVLGGAFATSRMTANDRTFDISVYGSTHSTTPNLIIQRIPASVNYDISQQGTSRLYIKTGTGYVGINTNNPLYYLDVNGASRFLSAPIITNAPTTSAGTYDFLSRNASTGIIEKIASATLAPVASPALTGTPTAPTAIAGTNTTQLATTAFVQTAITGVSRTLDQVLTTGNTSTNAMALTGSGVTSSYSGIGFDVSQNPDYLTIRKNVITLTNLTTGYQTAVYSNNINFQTGSSSQTIKPYAGAGATTDYVLPVKPSGTEIFAMQSDFNKSYTVATLPTPSGTAYAVVTDALAPTYMTTIVGGGSVVTPVFYNGTNWVAH